MCKDTIPMVHRPPTPAPVPVELAGLGPLLGMLGGFLPGLDGVAAAAAGMVKEAEERIGHMFGLVEQIAADVAAIRKAVEK